MSRPNKKQHKVPRTYLEAFTGTDGRLWVSDKKLHIYPEKPKNILTENDFYTVRFPGGGGTLEVETKYLGGIEAAYATIYKDKISQRQPLTANERAVMAIFVASMLERSPRRREALQDGFDQIRAKTEQMRAAVAKMTPAQKKALAIMQAPMSEEDRKNSIPADELLKAGEDVASFHSAGIPESVAAIAPIIFKMNWGFMVRPVGSEPFVTSDSPCTMDNPSLPVRSIYGPGLAQKDIEVTMTLSPDLAVLCGWKLENDGNYLSVGKGNVEEINRRIVRRSETLVSNDKAMLERQVARVRAFLAQQKTEEEK